MKRAGMQAYFVAGNDSYLGAGRFSRAWDIDAVREVPEFRPVGEVVADLVFDKADFAGRDVPVVTDQKVREACNKAETYRRFGKYQPETVLCADEDQLQAAIRQMPGDMVVVKNPAGSGGKRVYIDKKASIQIPSDETYPLLVQEFIDMTDGVPGIVDGPHDLRVLIAGGTITGGTLRQPMAGKLHANTGQGGSLRLLAAEEIPEEVRHLALAIDKEFDGVPRYYSTDFARGKNGWRLIELNTKPGLYYKTEGSLADQHMQNFVNYIMSLV
ncbi:MAG TPA: hypothetical protein VHQ86_00875 [Candidatus Saccharimonadia bacterium]|nr:hypothetical protein [Candidatus Saccharimonadia bacterium]